ncbi:hypothetical protein LTR62_007279 [Meristemomyces frigidus]|uniref:Uncharacterized protein n=1 Tax=Meristemomyces frigidus TaxID=1508187 RepID=A0AAN7TJ22_9PEZI|nr:hypothetical protein LTR62_007279 [Meristemomyces frigidus]
MASHVPFLAVRPNDQFSSDPTSSQDSQLSEAAKRDLLDPIADMDAPPIQSPRAARAPAASRLPAFVRFPMVVIISLALSTFFNTLIADFTGYELAAVSRDVTSESQIATLMAWKLVELGFAWWAGYDWQDLSSLAILSNLPYYFLLTTFYNIDSSAAAISLAIETAVIGIPFALLRPLIRAHEPGSSPNQQVAQDRFVGVSVGLLGAAIYAVVIYGSLYTWLPVYLVQNFDGLRSLEGAHNASIPMLVLSFLPLGWATVQFLFTPVVGSHGNPGITDPALYPEKLPFDGEAATFSDTIAYNLGFSDGFSKRAETLFKRTAVLIACSTANTFTRVLLTVEGSEPVGAAGWASVWGVAALMTSVVYGFVANE